MNEMIDGDLDDILLIVEENLKEYIAKQMTKITFKRIRLIRETKIT